MRIPLAWLNEWFEAPLDPARIAAGLAAAGFELEGLEYVRPGLETVVTGKLLTTDPHPNADRLRICSTDIAADAPLQIVTAATNVRQGDVVPVALVGSKLPTGQEILLGKLRGVESQGMFCSEEELGMARTAEGVMVLPADTPLGRPIATVLGLGDPVLDIAITANRGDGLSVQGIARELAATGLGALRAQARPDAPADRSAGPAIEVRLAAPGHCPRYMAQVISGLKVGPSPEWLAKRLELSGIRSISNVVDAMNLVMLELGQPLHAFDLDRIDPGSLTARLAQEGETIRTLDGQVRTLQGDMLVIADQHAPHAIAGVMGGFDSAVGEGTTRILIEAAWFSPARIRMAARQLKLHSESSHRFERGIDPEAVPAALARAAALVVEVAGGQVQGPTVDARHEGFPQDLVLKLRPGRTTAILGVDIPTEAQARLLVGLGFQQLDSDEPGKLAFKVPGWRRQDVTREIDLIEEIARLHGFDNIPETLPPALAPAPGTPSVTGTLRQLLQGQGFSEVITSSLVNPEAEGRFLGHGGGSISLQDPLGDFRGLRRSLLPGLVGVAQLNLNRGAGSLLVFEEGMVHELQGDTRQSRQELVALAVGPVASGLWAKAPDALQSDFFWAKGLATHLLAGLGVGPLEALRPSDMAQDQPLGAGATGILAALHPGRTAILQANGQTFAVIGELHPALAEAHDLGSKPRTAVVALDTAAITRLRDAKPPFEYQPVSRFPGASRDLAILVPEGLPAGAVCAAALEAGKPTLESVSLFDRYQGSQVPEGRVSLGLTLRYRLPDRTLTDAEVEAAHDSILARLVERFGASRR